MSPFDVIRISGSQAVDLESLGTKRKFWLVQSQGLRLLFKAEERGTGEDWAEKIACELAERLGIPHVTYELAQEVDTGTPGVVCESCLEGEDELVHGNQLLLAADPDYPPVHQRFKVAAHTVEAVLGVLRTLEPPDARWMASAPEGLDSAVDLFVGYLMLDAWVANQDRHHENWGAIRRGEVLSLAPSFDHGACLARNLSDEERHERSTSRDVNRQVPTFAKKARSALYASPTDTRSLTTVAAFRAASAFAPHGAERWLERLRGVGMEEVRETVERVPPQRLSAVGRRFTLHLLEENRRRLLDGDEA